METAPMQPSVSLILATIGTTDRLPRLARSLAAQSVRDFELIVVNQGAPEALDPFFALLPGDIPRTSLRSPKGLSRARNVGLAAARGGIVGFPDDDAWYPATLVDTLAQLFRREAGLDMLTGVTRDADGALSNGTFLEAAADLDAANVWNAGNSNSIFVRRAPALAVKGFDETLGAGSGTPFGSGEETDLLLRLLAAGHRGRFLPDLVVHHDQVDQRIAPSVLRRAQLYAQGYGRVLRLHGYSRGFVAWRVGRSLAAAALAGGRGRLAEAQRRLIWARGILDGYAMPLGATGEPLTGSGPGRAWPPGPSH